MAAPLKIEYRKLEGLKPFARNARQHSEAQIELVARSITEYGWTNPLLIDAKGVIIAGHCRALAAARLGMADVPAIVLPGLTSAQKRALVLADNQMALRSSWDADLLRSELGELRDGGFDMNLTGFDTFELADIFTTRVGKTDPDDVPALEDKAITKLGETWLLGPHRLTCGDSTKADVVARALAGAKPHLMVTDPPYGVSYDADWRNRAVMIKGEKVGQHGSRATGQVQNDDRADWSAAWALFPGTVAYVWHGGLHSSVVEQSLLAAKFRVRSQIIWVKTRPVISRGDYHWQHEPAFYATADKAKSDSWQQHFVPEHEEASYAVAKGEPGQWAGDRKQSTVWMIEHVKSETGHSTQKPVECMKRPILNNSKPGQHVYEPFSGSGTTIVAAEMTGRICLAIDLSPQYVDVAVRRWQAFVGKEAVHADSGQTFEAIAAKRRKAKAEAA